MANRYHATNMGRCGRLSVPSQGTRWGVIGDVRVPRARRRSLPMFAQVRRRRVPASYVATIARARRSQTQRRRHSSSAKAAPLTSNPPKHRTQATSHPSPSRRAKSPFDAPVNPEPHLSIRARPVRHTTDQTKFCALDDETRNTNPKRVDAFIFCYPVSPPSV